MDDLIGRKTAIEYLMTNMGWCDEDGYQVDDADEKRTHIEDLINGIPSVPAVPLEPLCRYLAVYARTPIYNMRHTAEWWKEELNRQKWNEWMDGGERK